MQHACRGSVIRGKRASRITDPRGRIVRDTLYYVLAYEVSIRSLPPQQRRIAVTEETVAALERVLVDLAPFVTDESGNKQEQRASGLMEVRDQSIRQGEPIARCDEQARSAAHLA